MGNLVCHHVPFHQRIRRLAIQHDIVSRTGQPQPEQSDRSILWQWRSHDPAPAHPLHRGDELVDGPPVLQLKPLDKRFQPRTSRWLPRRPSIPPPSRHRDHRRPGRRLQGRLCDLVNIAASSCGSLRKVFSHTRSRRRRVSTVFLSIRGHFLAASHAARATDVRIHALLATGRRTGRVNRPGFGAAQSDIGVHPSPDRHAEPRAQSIAEELLTHLDTLWARASGTAGAAGSPSCDLVILWPAL